MFMPLFHRRFYYESRVLGNRLLQYVEKASEKYIQSTTQLMTSNIDPVARDAHAKAVSQYEALHNFWKDWKTMQSNHDGLEVFIKESDDKELQCMAREDLIDLERTLHDLENQIKAELLKGDEDDSGSAILEIRAGTGGDEAALFTSELYEMYKKVAQLNGWDFQELTLSGDGPKSVREATAKIDGSGVFGALKFESGVHRVQRVPLTESQGRIHTSTATVAIMPQPENLAMTIPEKDIRIDVYRSGGAGGQNANKTNSAVRAVHIPTGLMVCIQEERSQQTNKMRALAILQSRVYQLRKDELDAQRKSHRQAQIGNADRSEKIRTYNFPQGRITDHRINHSLFNIEAFFQGKTLEEFIHRLKLQEETRNLEGLDATEIT